MARAQNGDKKTARSRPRQLKLRDGRLVTLRAIRESDADEIVQGFGRLSKDSRYARFMHHKPQINEQALARGVRPKPGREFVYVATIPAVSSSSGPRSRAA